MNDIQTIMNDTLTEKFDDGTVKKMVSNHLDKFINDIISSCLDSWSEPSKALKEKISNTMLSIIEKHDFAEYLIKLDTILTECIKSSVITENKALMENLKTVFMEDDTEKEITIDSMFDRYKEYIENNFKAEDEDDIDWDTEDGEYTAYVDVKCDIKSHISHYRSIKEKSYDVVFSCEHMKEKYEINVYKYDFDKEFRINFSPDFELKSIRFVDEFALYLLNLSQRDIKITECYEDIYEDEVMVRKED